METTYEVVDTYMDHEVHGHRTDCSTCFSEAKIAKEIKCIECGALKTSTRLFFGDEICRRCANNK